MYMFVCMLPTPPHKHLNFEIHLRRINLHTILTHRKTLFRHGCDSYALPGENFSTAHFEGFH